MSAIDESTRGRYRPGWSSWVEFCNGVGGVSPRLDPSKDGRVELMFGFPKWGYRITRAGYSGLLTRCAAIRAPRLVGGCVLIKASFRVMGPPMILKD